MAVPFPWSIGSLRPCRTSRIFLSGAWKSRMIVWSLRSLWLKSITSCLWNLAYLSASTIEFLPLGIWSFGICCFFLSLQLWQFLIEWGILYLFCICSAVGSCHLVTLSRRRYPLVTCIPLVLGKGGWSPQSLIWYHSVWWIHRVLRIHPSIIIML